MHYTESFVNLILPHPSEEKTMRFEALYEKRNRRSGDPQDFLLTKKMIMVEVLRATGQKRLLKTLLSDAIGKEAVHEKGIDRRNERCFVGIFGVFLVWGEHN